MNGQSLRKNLTYFAALCYIVFLMLDWFMPSAWQIASGLKFAGLLACVTIALLGSDATLRAALLLTAGCDYLLLFTNSFAPAVLSFACAQLLHAHRHAGLAALPRRLALWPWAGLAAAAGAVVYVLARDVLYAACALYAVMLLTAATLAVLAMARGACQRRAALCVAGGMLLFVLCDICVAAHHLGSATAAPLMWLFYLPSQWLLAQSAPAQEDAPPPRGGSRKGIKDPHP